MKKSQSEDLFSTIYSDPRYAGCHVIIIAGKVYTAKTGKKRVQLLKELIKKYPSETPLITYIPKADTLILVIS